ncbi:MAG: hypothetical protein CVU99_05955 [Firmicutes bacterium HGW-Firmicutes-4]|jgi:drug/metabolite transporter (DMT)-like permease|nr:MAG: hypothetical protein CVU99_05955 [Firmicutes bacterium HGW-Firmicutes-4]
MNENVKARLHKKNLKYVKYGIAWAVTAGLTYGVGPTFQTFAIGVEPFASLSVMSLMLLPMMMAAMQDGMAAIVVFLKNAQEGKHREYFRVAKTKPGRFIMLAAFFGGPLALGCYMAAVALCGPVYSLIFTAMLPAFGALASRVFLKEHINGRAWVGIALAVVGAIIVGWVPPSGEAYPQFYLGVIFALTCAIGWALEMVVATAGMDFVDPEIAIGFRFVISGLLSFVAIPIVSGLGLISWGYFFESLSSLSAVWMIGAALFAGGSYYFYYRAGNAAGAARSMAINPIMTISATVLGVVIFGATLQINFFIGLVVLLTGCVLVVGKPSELISLRDID